MFGAEVVHLGISRATRRLTEQTMADADAGRIHPVIASRSLRCAVIPIGKRVDRHLMRWARWKYKRLKRSEDRTRAWLKGVRQRLPNLFAHWALRYTT